MIIVGHLASCLILNEITSVQFSKVYILMVDGAMAPISFSEQFFIGEVFC